MQRFILIICCFLSIAFSSSAQSSKPMASFAQFQQYFNPSLTGFQGSMLKSLYRNQWTGFEDAPKTLIATAELDLQHIHDNNKGYQLNTQNPEGYLKNTGAKHAFGVAVLYDQFGPSKETQLQTSYGSGIRLTEKLAMRWGAAVTYSSQYLDGNSLTVDQENDPKYNNVLGHSNRIGKVDINLGLSIATERFYLGYAMLDITKGKLITTGDDYLKEFYTQKHIVQTGYRTNVSEQLGLVLNGIYKYDEVQEGVVEGQLKAVYQNMLWVGAGYRKDEAYNLTGGIRLNQLSVHYAYETPVQEARYINKPTNEIVLGYNLRSLSTSKSVGKVAIW